MTKTGYFKGKPFWGSWLDRHYAGLEFNDALRSACDGSGFSFVEWPGEFLNEYDELDFCFMEKPRSVHISPEHYMWKI